MADDVLIVQPTAAGAGETSYPVAADDVGGKMFQRMKLDVGGDGASVPVEGALPVSATALPLPAGAATQATLAALLTELLLKARLADTQPVSAAALPLPAGAATQVTLAAILAELLLKADLTDTQPVSIAAALALDAPTLAALETIQVGSSALPTGAATQATLAAILAALPAAITGAGNLKVSIQEDGGAVLGVDDNGGSLTVDSPNLDVALSTRLKPADTLAGVTALGSITNPLPAGTNLIGQAAVPPSTLVVTAVSGANASVTATLPSVVGQFHYISRIVIERIATTAVVGSAVLTFTSTNLNGWARSTGNAAPVGVLNKDVDEVLGSELRSQAAATNTTIVAPAGGATVIVRITVYYRAAA